MKRIIASMVLLALVLMPAALGEGCVYHGELIGTEYIDLCDVHAPLGEAFLSAMRIEAPEERLAALDLVIDDALAALDDVYMRWTAVNPEQADVIAAGKQSYLTVLSLHAAILTDGEAALAWQARSLICECARVCGMYN